MKIWHQYQKLENKILRDPADNLSPFLIIIFQKTPDLGEIYQWRYCKCDSNSLKKEKDSKLTTISPCIIDMLPVSCHKLQEHIPTIMNVKHKQ